MQNNTNYKRLLDDIGSTIQTARFNAITVVNTELVKANWGIGKHIIEFEQKGKEKAEYGIALLSDLSKDLKLRYGKGFSKSNLYSCRLFYLNPNSAEIYVICSPNLRKNFSVAETIGSKTQLLLIFTFLISFK